MAPAELENLRSPTRWCDCAGYQWACPCGGDLAVHEPPSYDPTFLAGDRICGKCGVFSWADETPLVRPGTCAQCRLLATIDFLEGRGS